MEQTTQTTRSRTSPKDFFLWFGAIIALYGSITSFITLKFQYIDRLFPDALAGYADPYGGPVRIAMAGLIVLVPTLIALLWLIQRSITAESGKAAIWVRRWAIGLTLFIATATILIDLVTLINVFLGGEVTTRFALKVLTILVVAGIVFAYFLADVRGYWLRHVERMRIIAIAIGVGTIAAIAAGFFIIGTPNDIRAYRLDAERVDNLRSIQYQLIDYWRVKQALPDSLDGLKDPLSETAIPTDPLTGASYTYEKTAATSFKLCADFAKPSQNDLSMRGSVPVSGPGGGAEENWKHDAGTQCFERTIDPEKYPRIELPTKAL